MLRYLSLLVFLMSGLLVGGSEFTVPFQKKAPVIDGRFEAGEWDASVAFSGNAGNMDARRTTVWFAYDNEKLYVALQAETPLRGNLRAVPDGRNNNDSLELWFSPPQKLRSIETLKFGSFQLIVDSRDEVFAMHINPGYGLAPHKWKHNASIKSRIENKVWTLEMAFPLREMGITGSPEGDWKIMACRNYGIAPGYQGPMSDVGGFMDSGSYSTFRLKKGVLAVQHLYGGNARRPLRFRVTNTGDKPVTTELELKLSSEQNLEFRKKLELAPGKTVEQDFTAECNAENSKGRAESRIEGWFRTFNWNPPALPIWRNTESYQTLSCGFDAEKTLPEYTTVPDATVKITPPLEDEPATLPGPSASRRILDLSGRTLDFPKNKLSSPGAVAFWMRVDAPLKKGKQYRRFMGTVFTNRGYIFFQEQREGGMLLGAQYFGPANKGAKMVFVGRRSPNVGQWMHVAVNFLPKSFEIYINGIRRAMLQHNLEIDLAKVGSLKMENASFADLNVYSRPLLASEITALAQGDKLVTGTVKWYQSLDKVVADLVLDCGAVPEKKLQLQVRNEKDAVIETVDMDFADAVVKVDGDKQMATLRAAYSLKKKLADGKYSFFLTKPGSDVPLYERAFEVRDYPWLNNRIGMEDKLVEGFTPLKRSGSKLSAVLKDITLGRNGLPESVMANGGEVLARPVNVVALKNGRELKWKFKAPKFITETDTSITAESQLECDALKIEANIRMEQDGLIRYDWKLTPGNKPLPDRLYVDIPVKKEVAELFHAVGEGLRQNPAGNVPAGQGRVFASRSIQQANFESFLPYIWVGDDYRGISYAADWDKGWCHTKERDGVELHREKDGTVIIRLNFLNAPEKLSADNTITFALLPSPVKPMPKGWRGWRDGFTNKGTQISRCFYSPPYWGSFFTWTARYPAFQDFEYWDKLIEAHKTGKIDREYVNNWIKRIVDSRTTPDGVWVASKNEAQARDYVGRHVNHAFNIMAGTHSIKDKAIIYCYTCNFSGVSQLPEYPVMRDEWERGQMINESYVDYAIYYLDKMLEHGFTGIYNDNVFLGACYSWVNGAAWIDGNGEVHPSMGLWRSRNYHRRQAITMQNRGLKPWITAHHTNTNMLATLGFTTNTMGMEWKYGINDFQERFSSEYIRAVCSGRQGGCYPTILDGIVGGKTPEIKYWATRTMLASLLPHEVQPTCPRSSNYKLVSTVLNKFFDFGTWKDDCVVHHFWDESSPVKCSNSDLKQITYRRGKELLTFIGSFAGEDCTAEMEYGTTVASAVNDENGQALEASGSKVKFTLKKHDFIMIRAKLP